MAAKHGYWIEYKEIWVFGRESHYCKCSNCGRKYQKACQFDIPYPNCPFCRAIMDLTRKEDDYDIERNGKAERT